MQVSQAQFGAAHAAVMMCVGMSRVQLLLVVLVVLVAAVLSPTLAQHCSLPASVKNNIIKYQDKVDTIIQAALNDKNRHTTYNGLQAFVNRFGARPSGSRQLEDAIDYLQQTARRDGFRVHTEKTMVPHWVRGEETLLMVRPRRKSMSILGLGTTIGTQQYPAGVLRAEAVVFTSFEEMEKAGGKQVSGKIVVFNAPFGEPGDLPQNRYSSSNKYRTTGAARAAKLGAVAMLVRSRTDYSLYSPHTGSQYYDNTTVAIPAAAVTLEDANTLARLHKQGEPIELLLKMSAANLPFAESRNLIIDFGPEDATELVLLSAHVDSWDVGDGAMDNGAGVFVNYHSVKLLKQLGLRPKRMIRSVFWTGEEFGYYGGIDYVKAHEYDVEKMQIALENDLGTFRPLGLRVKGSDEAMCFVRHTTALFRQANATGSTDNPALSETHLLHEKGVPVAALDTDQSRYFWYHHTDADTMDALDPDELDLCVATMASAAFVFADVSDRVPRSSAALGLHPAMDLAGLSVVAALFTRLLR